MLRRQRPLHEAAVRAQVLLSTVQQRPEERHLPQIDAPADGGAVQSGVCCGRCYCCRRAATLELRLQRGG